MNATVKTLTCIKKCFLATVTLVLLSISDGNQYPTLGARMSCALTDGVDVSSLITQCSNIWPRFPPPNRFACYRTRTRSIGPFQTCDATLVRETDITRIHGNENFTQLQIQSPGRLRDRTYNSRLLCRWNVVCESDQILYMDVVEHNIEPMQFSSLFRKDVCVDNLKAFRDFGTETSCGFRTPYTDLEPRELRLEFRSNRKLRFPGFRMRLACFNPELQDMAGCSPTNDLAVDQLRQRLRVKRQSEKESEFEKVHFVPPSRDGTQEVPFLEKYLNYFDEVSPVLEEQRGRRIKRHSTQQFKIDQTATLYFQNRVLVVIANGSTILFQFSNIDTVYTYNIYEGIETFPSDYNVKQTFQGRGVLTILGNRAFFVIFGVDLSQFEPNVNETIAIRALMEFEEEMLNMSNRDLVINDNAYGRTYLNPPTTPPSFSKKPEPVVESVSPTEATTTESLHQSTVPPEGPTQRPRHHRAVERGKRQAGMLETEVMEAARRGANSCNAILRGIAQSVLELAK